MSSKSSKGVGKRAFRSARIKTDVFKGMLRIIGTRQLDEVHVNELCSEANISKVTFFKYFPQKDDVLFYYMRIWCFDRTVEIKENSLEGMKGMYFLFDRMAETHERYPGLVMSMLIALASRKRPSVPLALRLPERQLLFNRKQELIHTDILNVPQLMEKFLLEGIMKREIRNVGDTRDLSLLFLSIFYGTLLARHNRSMDSLRSEFRRNLELMLNGLKVR